MPCSPIRIPEVEATAEAGDLVGELGVFSASRKNSAAAVAQTDVFVLSAT